MIVKQSSKWNYLSTRPLALFNLIIDIAEHQPFRVCWILVHSQISDYLPICRFSVYCTPSKRALEQPPAGWITNELSLWEYLLITAKKNLTIFTITSVIKCLLKLSTLNSSKITYEGLVLRCCNYKKKYRSLFRRYLVYDFFFTLMRFQFRVKESFIHNICRLGLSIIKALSFHANKDPHNISSVSKVFRALKAIH